MKLSPWCVACGIVFPLFYSPRAEAAVLAEYNFPGTNTFVSSDADSNSTASNFLFSGMGTSGSDHGRSTATGSPNLNTIFTRGHGLTTSEAGALSGNDYYTFTLSPLAGYSASLTSLTFRSDSTYLNSASGYSTTIFVRSSLDGFASNLATIVDGPATTETNYNNRSISLTDPAFQNLSSPVTFRIYLFQTGTNATNIDAVFRSDSYILNGTMAVVPEPNAFFMVGIGIGLLSLARRQNHSGKI